MVIDNTCNSVANDLMRLVWQVVILTDIFKKTSDAIGRQVWKNTQETFTRPYQSIRHHPTYLWISAFLSNTETRVYAATLENEFSWSAVGFLEMSRRYARFSRHLHTAIWVPAGSCTAATTVSHWLLLTEHCSWVNSASAWENQPRGIHPNRVFDYWWLSPTRY